MALLLTAHLHRPYYAVAAAMQDHRATHLVSGTGWLPSGLYKVSELHPDALPDPLHLPEIGAG